MATIHLCIKGKVQGVFYRASAKEIADKLSLTGWVKNTKEGNVEVLVSGDQHNLESFITWCRRGPENAIVEDVEVSEFEDQTFKSFSILRY